MAVPFNMPEDQNEVEVIIGQLQTLLAKLQAALRRSNSGTSQQSLSVNPRFRATSSSRPRARNHQEPPSTTPTPSPTANLPDLLSNLAWLASAGHESVRPNTSQLAVPRRIRSDSESSCGEQTKMAVAQARLEPGLEPGQLQDWNQVGASKAEECQKEEADGPETPQPKTALSDAILSKFVPGPMAAPLWTAVICVVGWHLFRAR